MSELQPSVDWQATCDQLRQALTQQAQEIERLKVELKKWRDSFVGHVYVKNEEWSAKCEEVRSLQHRHGEVLVENQAQRETIRRLEEKLSSSRQEVDRAVYDYCVMKEKKDDLQARLTASEAKHKWTKKPPTKEGFYWLRAPKHGWRDAVVWIEKDGDGPESYFYMPDDDSTPVNEVDGSWQGPLTPGEE